MVSVVIATYNRSGIIGDTIQSVFNQTYSDFEIVVVSDGQDEKTKKAVYGFRDKRIRYYEINHSGRPAVPRNFGIKKARGEFIAFCDDDDIWLPKKLELQMKKMLSDDKIGLVYAKCFAPSDKGGIVIPDKDDSGKEGMVFKELFLSYNFIPNSTVLIKRQVIENVGVFNEDIRLKAIEDFDLWLRITHQYEVGFVNEILAIHKESVDSISKSTIGRWKREWLVTRRFYYEGNYVGLKLFTTKMLLLGCRCIRGIIKRSNFAQILRRKKIYV